MTRQTWDKALAIWQKAGKEGIILGRTQLASILSVSDREAREILFSLKHLNLIRCDSSIMEACSGEVVLAIGDLHIPYQDDAAIEAALSYAERRGINTICLMGDIMDFYQISSFGKNPLRSKRLFEEIKQGKEFLQSLRNRFPEAKIIYYAGNHEERLARYIYDKAPQLSELIDNFLPEKLGIPELNMTFEENPFKIGKLWYLHGHEKGKGSYNPEWITNVVMGSVYDHFITFHYHRSQDKVFKRIGGRYFRASSVGYLAGEMDYARMNKWQQGFALITYFEDGEFSIENKTIINGKVF